MSASSRPTGTMPGRRSIRSTTVRRPWGSCAVVTTPAGLWRRTYVSFCGRTRSPSTSTTSREPTAVFSSPGAPFTRTRPALIRSSARRREATPARARYAFSLMPSLFGCAALHLADALDLAGRGRASRLARARRGGGADHRGGRRRAHRRLRDTGALRRGRDLQRAGRRRRGRDPAQAPALRRGALGDAPRVHARRSRSDHPQAD